MTAFVWSMALVMGSAFAQDPVDLQRKEQEIRALARQWLEAVQAGDHAAAGAMFAADGLIMPPNAPWGEGTEAAAAFWQGIIELPNLSVAWAPTRVAVAQAGDMAYEIGTYSLSFDSDQGPLEDEGKYVVVWVRQDGAWKVAADIFNSDLPAP